MQLGHKLYTYWRMAHNIIVFPTAKKKGRALNRKMGHCKHKKGATFSENGYFSFDIRQLEQAN